MEFPVSGAEEGILAPSRWRDGFNDFWGLAFSSDERKERERGREAFLSLYLGQEPFYYSALLPLLSRSAPRVPLLPPAKGCRGRGVGGGLFRDERKRYGEGERKASRTRVEG